MFFAKDHMCKMNCCLTFYDSGLFVLILFSIFPRKDCIFTIDPSTARDLDDALSCRPLSDGRMEISLLLCAVGNLCSRVLNTHVQFPSVP